jgi:hypothetical protein
VQLRAKVGAGAAALAAVAVPAAQGVTQPARPAHPDTRAMVIQLADLPTGFGVDQGSYVSNAELAKEGDSRKDYVKLGRLTGYNVTYKRPGLAGVLVLDAFASIYRSNTGAHDSLRLSLSGAAKDGGASFHWLPSGPALGSETRVYAVSTKQNGMAVDFYTIAWRHGRVFAEVICGGVSGRISPAQAMALARKQEARIAAALAS